MYSTLLLKCLRGIIFLFIYFLQNNASHTLYNQISGKNILLVNNNDNNMRCVYFFKQKKY